MEMTINLEAVSTAAEATRTNGKNWIAVGVGLTASTQSWVEPGSLCICVNNEKKGRSRQTTASHPSSVGHVGSANPHGRVAGLKAERGRNSRRDENSDGREAGDELHAEHVGGG